VLVMMMLVVLVMMMLVVLVMMMLVVLVMMMLVVLVMMMLVVLVMMMLTLQMMEESERRPKSTVGPARNEKVKPKHLSRKRVEMANRATRW